MQARWLPVLAVVALAGCSHGGGAKTSASHCRDFQATAARLQAAVQDLQKHQGYDVPDNNVPDATSSEAPYAALFGGGPTGPSDAEVNRAVRAYANLYVQDTTGCATAEDKAKAQAELDSMGP